MIRIWSFAIALLGLVFVAPHAVLAQDTSGATGPVPPAQILSINQAAVILAAEAGKDIGVQTQKLAEPIQSGLQAKAEAIEAKIGELVQKKDILAPEKLREQQEALLRERDTVLKEAQDAERRMNYAVKQAQARLWQEEAMPIAIEIMKSRGANMLIEKNSIYLAAEGLDITKAVIDKLNASGKKVTVTMPKPGELNGNQPAQ